MLALSCWYPGNRLSSPPALSQALTSRNEITLSTEYFSHTEGGLRDEHVTPGLCSMFPDDNISTSSDCEQADHLHHHHLHQVQAITVILSSTIVLIGLRETMSFLF